MKKLKISCKEAALLSTKRQYVFLGCFDWVRFHLHILHCPDCQEYDRQNNLMSHAVTNYKAHRKITLSDAALRRFQREMAQMTKTPVS